MDILGVPIKIDIYPIVMPLNFIACQAILHRRNPTICLEHTTKSSKVAGLAIVVDIGVSGLYEIFDKANDLFQFVAFD